MRERWEAYVDRAVEWEVESILTAVERHNAIRDAAVRIGRFSAPSWDLAREVDAVNAEGRLIDAGVQTGKSLRHVTATVQDGLTHGAANCVSARPDDVPVSRSAPVFRELRAIWRALLTTPLRASKDATDDKALRALVIAGMSTGSLTLSQSYRQWALASGSTHRTLIYRMKDADSRLRLFVDVEHVGSRYRPRDSSIFRLRSAAEIAQLLQERLRVISTPPYRADGGSHQENEGWCSNDAQILVPRNQVTDPLSPANNVHHRRPAGSAALQRLASHGGELSPRQIAELTFGPTPTRGQIRTIQRNLDHDLDVALVELVTPAVGSTPATYRYVATPELGAQLHNEGRLDHNGKRYSPYDRRKEQMEAEMRSHAQRLGRDNWDEDVEPIEIDVLDDGRVISLQTGEVLGVALEPDPTCPWWDPPAEGEEAFMEQDEDFKMISELLRCVYERQPA